MAATPRSARSLGSDVSYRGTAYNGWQSQPDGDTVQDQLERALCDALPMSPVRTMCAGRTDAGVHALNQVVHFDAPVAARGVLVGARHQPLSCRADIAVQWSRAVPDDFHARYQARGRRYALRAAANRRCGPSLETGPAWAGCSTRCGLDAMRSAARRC